MFIPGAQGIAAIAKVVSGIANIGAQALYRPPPARGSVTNVLIAPDAPSPYVMGEGYFAGVIRHDVAYGATLKKVPNPYRFMAAVYSVAGPVDSISPRVDLAAVSSWYSGFLYTGTKLGTSPESSALTPQFGAAPGWGSTSKLSGQAAIGWSFKFDKDGKRFASGIPRIGAYGKWVKVYDPRLDSTFPGGSGSCRLGVESTYVWSENPALHAGTYAYGRIQNGKRVFGIGLPVDGIDWVNLAGWANVCQANSWTIFGVIYEPGNRWENLKEICAAGGGEPVFAGGLLSWKFSAPKIALDTITEADIADESCSVTAMASWRDRMNTIVPKYRSAVHDWDIVPLDTPISVPTYVTEDGEEKKVEWPFNFVKVANQAAQLGAYKLMDSRELQPITLSCNPRLRKYRPGECLHIDLPRMGLDTDAIILSRSFDPVKMTVTLTLMGETPGKHDYCLGRTGTPPPTPALKQSGTERDELLWLSGQQAPTDISPTPPAELPEGTLWIAPDGHPFRFGSRPWIGADGTPWLDSVGAQWWGSGYSDARDTAWETALAAALAAQALAEDAQATADGKVQSFFQPTAPVAEGIGDLWFDTDDGNKQYRWSGSAWVVAQDTGIGEALADAFGAQATADGKAATFFQEDEPTAEGAGDLWYKASTKTLFRRSDDDIAWIAASAIGVEDAADVTSQITGQAEITINADWTGAPTTSLPKVQPFVLIRNGVDVTAGAVWTVEVLSGTIDASFPSEGQLSLDDVAGELTTSTLRLTAVYGATTRKLDVRVAKVNAPPPSGGGGGSASSGISASIPDATPIAISGDLNITVAASGNVTLAASYSFTTALSGGSQSMTTEWYEWNGSAFVAVSGSAVAAASPYVPVSGESGEGSNIKALTGLTPAASKRYRLYGFNSGGTTGATRNVSGTASASSS